MGMKEYLETSTRKVKKKTATEYCSPCPFCGGDDRFCIWPEKDKGWCRQCNWSGDYIQLLIEKEHMEFKEAAEKAGKAWKVTPRTKTKIKKLSELKHPSNGVPDKTFKYLTLAGELHLVVCRWEPNNNGRLKKIVSQYNPYKGNWSGVKDLTPILYNLQMIAQYDEVYFVEGEKCVEALRSVGLAATTVAGGSQKADSFSEWQGNYQTFDPLRGKAVYILPDLDPSGDKYAKTAATELSLIAKDVKIINLPYRPPDGGDVVDYFKALRKKGETNFRAALETEVKNAPNYKPYMTAGELYEKDFSKQPDLIYGGILPATGHMLIAGESGVGKSLLRMELAIHLAMGIDWLGFKIPKRHRVAIFQYENTKRQEQYRLSKMLKGLGIAINEVRDNIFWMNRDRLNLANITDRNKLESMVKQSGCDVMIYDCLSNMHQEDENKNIKLRAVVDTLSDIDEKLGKTCILVHHFGKPSELNAFKQATNSKHRIRGASSLVDWAMTAVTYENVRTQNGDDRILRKLDFVKVRDGKEPKPILLARDEEDFLLEKTDPNTRISPDEVAQLAWDHLDHYDSNPIVKQLTKAIYDALGGEVGKRQCTRYIHNAEAFKTIKIKVNKSRQGKPKEVIPLAPRKKEDKVCDNVYDTVLVTDDTNIPNVTRDRGPRASQTQASLHF